MKKTEPVKTSYGSYPVASGMAAPAAPAPGMPALPNRRNADPSSAARSSRYPEPSIGFRVGPAD